MKTRSCFLAWAALLVCAAPARADITVLIGHNNNEDATPVFEFRGVPPPDRSGGAPGKFTIVDGRGDPNGAGLEALTDGRTPTEEDQPEENFFFDAGTPGGRLRLDLTRATPIQQINTYSWHPGSRGPQVYKVYGATGDAPGFNPAPKRETDPAACGWTLIAAVDTRPKGGGGGGQYGVSIGDSSGRVGEYRYLLFDCSATEMDDDSGNTFYSEINVLVVGARVPSPAAAAQTNAAEIKPYVARSADGKYEIIIDTARAPDLTQWATNKLAPVLAEWYPKIVALLPSEGFQAPTNFRVVLRPGRGVAATGGTRITANARWIQQELNGQALGSLVHEAVHVVQQYGYARRHNPHPANNPGYLVEGIADYVRWFQYEPQSKGAEITARNLERANYDRSYRVTANFLNWVSEKYDKDIVPQLNAAMREGNYSTNLWVKGTGKTIEQLNTEWKEELKKKINGAATGGT
jgi:hypothetical protein